MSHRGRCGHGRGRKFGFGRRRFPDREEFVSRLEEHQRDLEQELADVSDVLKRLREDESPARATTDPATA
jgi:septation ring formation regulator EzrA